MTLTRVYAPALKFAVLFGVDGLAFLVVAIYSIVHLRTGVWATLRAFGGLIGALPELLFSFGWARLQVANDDGVFDFVSRHEVLMQSDWSRPAALTLIAWALCHRRGPRGRDPEAAPA